ncbi:MAG: TonB-dependent receptor, partial [Lysobacterales bacterium]
MKPTPRTFDGSRLAVFCLSVLAASAANAQTERKPKPVRLETVVVTATREAEDALNVPASVSRVEASDLRRARPRVNVSESLQRIPGVAARDRQNYAQDVQISIRGFGARATFGVRGVRLYTDGIPATMPDGQGQVSHFALDSAGAIEVLRGPFSALYGNSSGGVIQIFTAMPPTRPEFEFSAHAGSDNAWRASLGAAGSWDVAPGGYRVGASRFATGGFRDHSAARRDSAQALLQTEFAGNELRLIANSVDIDADDPQGLTRADLSGGSNRRAASPGALLFDVRKRVRQRQVGGRIGRDLGHAASLAVTAHAGRRETVQFLSVPVAAQRNPLSGGGVIDLDRDYAGLDARLRAEGEWLSRPLTLTAGIEVQSSAEDRLGFENFVGATLGVRGALRRDERNRVRGFDQYVQADWQPAPRWRVLAGARRSEVEFRSDDRYRSANNPDDSGSLRYAEVTPVVGVLFRVTPAISAYANAGQGFETPTFNELAYRSDASSGLNTALRASRSDNAEAGVRARLDRHSLDVAVFQSRTEGELAVASNAGGRSTFANAGESRRQGVEVALSGELPRDWRYALAYTWLDARYRDEFTACTSTPCTRPNVFVPAGARIPGIARHVAFAELVYAP